MTITVFYDSDRPSAPWCVHYHVAETTGELHFESRDRAEKYATTKGWRPSIKEQIAKVLDEEGADYPDELAAALLDRFNITERDTTT